MLVELPKIAQPRDLPDLPRFFFVNPAPRNLAHLTLLHSPDSEISGVYSDKNSHCTTEDEQLQSSDYL